MNNIKIRIYILWFVFALFLFSKFFAIKASATTYYVATNGSDNYAGSYSLPFRTIQKAADVVGAGDTVMVREGRYAGFTIYNVNGTVNSPVVFMSYPGEKVIVDRYLGAASRCDNLFVIMIFGGSHIILDGFEVMDTNVIRDGAHDLDANIPEELEIIKSYNLHSGINLRYINRNGPNHTLIKNVEVHHIGRQGITGGTHGIDNQFINIHIHHVGAYGYYLMGSNKIVKGNIIHDCKSHAMNLGAAGIDRTDDSIVEENICYDNGSENFYHFSSNSIRSSGDNICIVLGSNNIVRNNISYNNRGWGIRCQGDNNEIYNNTIYRSGRQGITVYEYQNEGQNNIIRNNISFKSLGMDGYSGEYSFESGNTHDHNLFGIDPKFLNADNGDFHLTQGSPAINKGITIPGFSTDIEGNSRDNAWDIGAYEYGGTIEPTYSISGTVVDENGDPIIGATVSAGGIVTQVQSNSTYLIDGLTNGNYNVTPYASNCSSFLPASRSVTVFNDNVTGIDFIGVCNNSFKPIINDVKIIEIANNTVTKTLRRNGVYDLYFYVDDPQGWENILDGDVWLHHINYDEGGDLYSRNQIFYNSSTSYLISLSIIDSSLWINGPGNRGSNVTGIDYLFILDSHNNYKINPDEKWVKARFQVQSNASLGDWVVDAIVTDKDRNISDLFKKNIYVQSNDNPSKPKNLKAFFVETP